VTLPPGSHRLRCRTGDASGHVQDRDLASAWNPRGYVNDAIHEIQLHAVPGGIADAGRDP
jgi:hypothetical protein